MRFFIEFSYKGTNYHGWQVQPNANTVQAEINKALSTLLNSKIEVMGAGRTDAGVHAKQMYAHFDYNTSFDVPKMIMKLNSFLPNDIANSKGIELTELMNELDTIVFSGTKLNINYMIDDIFDEEQQEELYDYFIDSDSDDINLAIDEFDGDYEELDLRLYRIKFINDISN